MSDHKEDFLDMLADCELAIEYDGDTNSNGRMVDCSTFSITGSLYALSSFLETIGIQRRFDESWEDAVQRAIEADRP